MGCVHSQQVSPTLPALLTRKSSGHAADKHVKHIPPVTATDESGTVGNFCVVAAPADNNPEVQVASADGRSPMPSLEEAERRRSLTPRTPPIHTLKSLDLDPARKESMQSFASSHSDSSAATNFTFGRRWTPIPTPTRSLNGGSISKLLALQEDTPWAPSPSSSGKHLGDMPEYYMAADHEAPGVNESSSCEWPEHLAADDRMAPDTRDDVPEDPMAHVGRTVDKTVHALVDAGEDAWGRAQAAWSSTRCRMLAFKEPGLETDSDGEENELETPRRFTSFRIGRVVCI